MSVPEATKQRLIAYADQYETADFIVGDPSWWMHQVKGVENQETMAFLASALSYGSRKQFMPKIGRLLEWSGGDVHDWVKNGAFEDQLREGDGSCFYRLYNKDCMNGFLCACRQMFKEYDTMGNFIRHHACDGFGAVDAICSFFRNHNASQVIPKNTMSACKRVCMFLRWMVRDNSPVDLGLWSDCIDKADLIMPLDTHVLQQSVKLGLLSSSTASMSAARRLSASMSEVFPGDPLRGDFALFGYGVIYD
ncbi:MAG: TIGR02757 family protein [Bacteroidales bacterium]|nr:TIGR02757 family protein [Bacteroidales bacterium]